jgi:hypothetical protein
MVELFDGFLETDLVEQLDKLDRVAACASAEALSEVSRGIDGERRGFLDMEGAKAHVAFAFLLELDTARADEPDQVNAFGRLDAFLLDHAAPFRNPCKICQEEICG